MGRGWRLERPVNGTLSLRVPSRERVSMGLTVYALGSDRVDGGAVGSEGTGRGRSMRAGVGRAGSGLRSWVV